MSETDPQQARPRLTKQQVIDLFGGKQRLVAEAIGVTPSAVSQWPDGELDQATSDRCIGAAYRLGKLQRPESGEGRAAA